MVFSVNPTRSHPHRHTCTYTLLFLGSKRGVYCKQKGLCHPVSVLTRQRPQRVGVAGPALNLARLGGRSWLLARTQLPCLPLPRPMTRTCKDYAPPPGTQTADSLSDRCSRKPWPPPSRRHPLGLRPHPYTASSPPTSSVASQSGVSSYGAYCRSYFGPRTCGRSINHFSSKCADSQSGFPLLTPTESSKYPTPYVSNPLLNPTPLGVPPPRWGTRRGPERRSAPGPES